MADLGRGLTFLAFAVAVYGIGAASTARSHRPARVGRLAPAGRSTRSPALTTGAFVVLEIAFLRNDFSFSVVQSHSSTTTPMFYKAAAAWSSQEGSLLLWLWLLSLWSSLAFFLTRHRMRDVRPRRPRSCSASPSSSSACWSSRSRRSTRSPIRAAEGNGPQPAAAPPER